MSSISTNVYIDRLYGIVKSNTYIDSNKDINDKDPKF